MLYILADNQELTRLGVEALCRRLDGAEVLAVQSKQQLIALLERECPAAPPVVVLDFTFFDLKDVEELLMMRQRFRNVHWVLLSDELTDDLISRVSAEGSAFSLVGKQCDALPPVGSVSSATP